MCMVMLTTCNTPLITKETAPKGHPFSQGSFLVASVGAEEVPSLALSGAPLGAFVGAEVVPWGYLLGFFVGVPWVALSGLQRHPKGTSVSLAMGHVGVSFLK